MSRREFLVCDWCGKEEALVEFPLELWQRKLCCDFCCQDHEEAYAQAREDVTTGARKAFQKIRKAATDYSPQDKPITSVVVGP